MKSSETMLSTTRTTMLWETLRKSKEFLDVFITLDGKAYFRVNCAAWTQLLYVLIVMNRIILLDSDPSKESSVGPNWDAQLAAQQTDMQYFGREFARKLASVTQKSMSSKCTSLMTSIGRLVRSLTEGQQLEACHRRDGRKPHLQSSSGDDHGAMQNQLPFATPESTQGPESATPLADTSFDSEADWMDGAMLDSAWSDMLQDMTIFPMTAFEGGFDGA